MELKHTRELAKHDNINVKRKGPTQAHTVMLGCIGYARL